MSAPRLQPATETEVTVVHSSLPSSSCHSSPDLIMLPYMSHIKSCIVMTLCLLGISVWLLLKSYKMELMFKNLLCILTKMANGKNAFYYNSRNPLKVSSIMLSCSPSSQLVTDSNPRWCCSIVTPCEATGSAASLSCLWADLNSKSERSALIGQERSPHTKHWFTNPGCCASLQTQHTPSEGSLFAQSHQELVFKKYYH